MAFSRYMVDSVVCCVVGILVELTACGFSGSPATSDSAIDAAIDAAIDGVPDAPTRSRLDLVGYWTFDDPPGSLTAADTAGTSAPVPLKLETSSTITAPVFANGMLRADGTSRVISTTGTHLAADCKTADAVTLEIWARPKTLQQGSRAEPRFVAGLGSNIANRNIAILQGDNRWIGMVRTSAAQDGSPRLESSSFVEDKLTHIVLVADATQRTIYIDGAAQLTDAPGSLSTWNETYAMALFDEPQHARQWQGTLALVALYARGLTAAEIDLHYTLGPAAP